MGALPPTVMLPILTASDFLRDCIGTFYLMAGGVPTADGIIAGDEDDTRWLIAWFTPPAWGLCARIAAVQCGIASARRGRRAWRGPGPCAWAARPRAAPARA